MNEAFYQPLYRFKLKRFASKQDYLQFNGQSIVSQPDIYRRIFLPDHGIGLVVFWKIITIHPDNIRLFGFQPLDQFQSLVQIEMHGIGSGKNVAGMYDSSMCNI